MKSNTEDIVYLSPRLLFGEVIDLIRAKEGFKAELKSHSDGQGGTSPNHFDLLVKQNDLLVEFTITCNAYGQNGKAEIHHRRPSREKCGGYVTVYRNNEKVESPSIKVSLEKTPEVITKDFFRRIWDEAVKVTKETNTVINEENQATLSKMMTINEIAYALKAVPKKHFQSQAITGEIDPYVDVKAFGLKGYGKVMVSGSNSVSIELTSMGKDFALDICKAIRTVMEKHASK